jgi:hypothetical protein
VKADQTCPSVDRLWTFKYLQLSYTFEFSVYSMEEGSSEDECILLSHAEEGVQAIRWALVLIDSLADCVIYRNIIQMHNNVLWD